jgi:hypothetical protein
MSWVVRRKTQLTNFPGFWNSDSISQRLKSPLVLQNRLVRMKTGHIIYLTETD